jgi:CRISPR-associated protein Cmr2
MADSALNARDWFATLSKECHSLVVAYDRDVRALEQKRRELKQRRRGLHGEERRKLEEEKRKRADRLFDDLREHQPAAPAMVLSGFADRISLWLLEGWPRKENTREFYMKLAQQVSDKNGGFRPPPELPLDPWPPTLFHGDWLALEVEFELLTPWYSKDDRLFHVLDNPVRKDRVFGVPYMAAASWKGMLRWACRMQAGLQDHLERGKPFDEWNDPDWVLHLFGNEKGEEKAFHQGALVFYPTWFDKIGFEVINPHDRSRRAGTQPIYYEVVPGRRPKAGDTNEYEEGGKGALRLLYAPWPGMKAETKPEEVLHHLLEAIETMLTVYGVSAKRTVGWGTAEIKNWQAWRKDTPASKPIQAKSWQELLKQLLRKGGGTS